MATWVKCTRRVDSKPIYLNLDVATSLRWDDEQNFTVVSLAPGKENIVRVLEHPDEIFSPKVIKAKVA